MKVGVCALWTTWSLLSAPEETAMVDGASVGAIVACWVVGTAAARAQRPHAMAARNESRILC